MFQILKRNQLRSVERKAEALAEALSAVAFVLERPEELDESIALSKEVAAGIELAVGAFASQRDRAAIAARTQALLKERLLAPRAAAAKAREVAREAEAKRVRDKASALTAKYAYLLENEMQEWERSPVDTERCGVWSWNDAPSAREHFPEPSGRQLREMAQRVRQRLAEEHSVRCDEAPIEMALTNLQEQRLAAQRNMSLEALRAAKAAALSEARGSAR